MPLTYRYVLGSTGLWSVRKEDPQNFSWGCNWQSEQEFLVVQNSVLCRTLSVPGTPSPSAGSTQPPALTIWQLNMLSHLLEHFWLVFTISSCELSTLSSHCYRRFTVAPNCHSRKHVCSKPLRSTFLLLLCERSPRKTREVDSLVTCACSMTLRVPKSPPAYTLPTVENRVHHPQIL